MENYTHKVVIKDSTLREGLDTPNLRFTFEQKLRILKLLDQADVPEIEVVAPSMVLNDLEFVKRLNKEELHIKISGLIYSYSPDCQVEIKEASKHLDRFDILMPVSSKRKPHDSDQKIRILLNVLAYCSQYETEVGVGFPHSTQVEIDFLLEICKEAVNNGAKRVVIYDTNGGSEPFYIYDLISRLKKELDVVLFFHGHNDLGLATANSLAAVYAGADGLDTTVNGLGDRAGNASFEQVVLNLHLKGFNTGVILQDLKMLSAIVEKESGVEVHKLAPIVGDYICWHKSRSHLENPELFEAFAPEIIGTHRKFDQS